MSSEAYNGGNRLSNDSPLTKRHGTALSCNHPGCTKQLAQNNTIGYCRQHRCDARLGPKLCKHAGCSARLGGDNKTGYCGLHKGDAKRPPDLSAEELKERKEDDRWEEHHGEKDTVACRICGQRWACLGSHGRTNHLLHDHQLTVPQYLQYCKDHGWGSPLTRSLKSEEAIAKWRDENPEKVKAVAQARDVQEKLLRATDPEARKRLLEQQRQGTARALGRLSEAEKARRISCPVPGCHLPFRSLGRHSRAIHNTPLAVLKHLYPDAPTAAPDLALATKMSELANKLWAERKEAAWRPDDWKDPGKWPAWKQSIALIMLEHPDLGAREIGTLMDQAKKGSSSRPPTDWGDSWERAFTENDAGKKMFYRILGALQH